MAVFLGYDAPALEEEYDSTYAATENLPYNSGSGNVSVSKYYMWNASASHGELFYYGATFVDRIGTNDNKTLVMVRPANGQNYDSFIFGQYFSATIDGNNAATQETLNVIAMIAALDKSITLEDEKAVVAAREAFNLLNAEQQALVTNLETLTGAETTIAYLKGLNPPAPGPDPDYNNHSDKNYGFIIGAAVAVLGCAAFVIVFVLNTKKKATASAAGEETVTEAKDDENTADENEADNGEKKD